MYRSMEIKRPRDLNSFMIIQAFYCEAIHKIHFLALFRILFSELLGVKNQIIK